MAAEYIPKILIIDDLEVNLITLEGNLRKLKVEIFKAQSGNEALIRIKQHDFALIIVDIQMPGMNGYEVAEQIRQGRRNQFTPIIFLTAVYFDQLSVYKGYQTGAVDYITKPFNFEILTSKVRVFLDLDRIKHELIESRRQFMDVVQDQTDMICRTDVDFAMSFVNQSMMNALSTDMGHILGSSIFSWIPEHENDKLIEAIAQLSPNNPVAEVQHSIKVTPDNEISVFSLIRALFSDDYEFSGYQWVIRDITEEITRREQLLIAKQKAEESTQSKSRFLAIMSHEARNPLNSILGMLDLLLESNLSEEQLDSVKLMQYSSKKLHQLLNDILDLSRIEANQVKFEVAPFNLYDEMKALVNSHEVVARQNNTGLKLTVDKNVPKIIISDALRLGQILSNLLNNSIKFTTNGLVELIVKSESINHKSATIRFTVKDNGKGITTDSNINIFDAFEQGGESVARTYGGSGLGLSISKGLCERMGGSLSYESKPDEGATFWFTLNFEIDHRDNDIKLQSLNFLIVEDNVMNQKVVGAILNRHGIKFDIAENGLVAYEKTAEKFYDVILMDIQMPEMDGYDATSLIRMREKENNSPNKSMIVALTANATAEDRNKCLGLGMDQYLYKPFKYADLEPIINKLL
jgi:PAS domain S-box-containing protein